MDDNVGKILKKLAIISIWISLIACSIFGGRLIGNEQVGEGLFVIIFGIFCLPIFPLMLYGFGDLIDKANIIAENTANKIDNVYDKKSIADTGFDNTKIDIWRLLVGTAILLVCILGVTFVYFNATDNNEYEYTPVIYYVN